MVTNESTPWPSVLALTSFVVLACAATQPSLDLDLFWHLRVGQWIQEQGQVPTIDPLSQLGRDEGRPWVAYSWLFEWLLAETVRQFGFVGLIWLRLGIVLLLTWAIQATLWRQIPHWPTAGLVLGLITLAIIPLTQFLRPWLFTMLFSWLTLHAILRLREGERLSHFLWLPLVYILWANIHIQFLFGLLLLSWAVVAHYFDDQDSTRSRHEWRLYPEFWLLIACTIATLINPYHVRIYLVMWEYASQPWAHNFVSDLRAMPFRSSGDWAAAMLLGLTFYTLGRRSPSLFLLGLAVACAFLTLRARRDLWYSGAAAVAVISAVRLIPWDDARAMPHLSRQLPILLMMAGLLVGLGRPMFEGSLTQRMGREIALKYPVVAVAWIQENKPPGPIFNDFDWGGYLSWALPEYPVLVDGRTNFYGDEFLSRNSDTWAGRDWASDANLRRAGVILANRETPLAELLRGSQEWKIACDDDPLSIVFVRR
jgi:hypothetical protein